VLCVDLIGKYTLTGKDRSSIDFMCLTMIDPETSWFEIVELPTVNKVTFPTLDKGKKATCNNYTKAEAYRWTKHFLFAKKGADFWFWSRLILTVGPDFFWLGWGLLPAMSFTLVGASISWEAGSQPLVQEPVIVATMSRSAAVDWACPECSYANVGGKYCGVCGEPYSKCMWRSVPASASKAPVAAIAMTHAAQDPGKELGGSLVKLGGKLLELSRANERNALCPRASSPP
jgi:hypothetical protein